MKTSIYINKENEERLKALLQGDKGLNTSKIINQALNDYFNTETFDSAELRKLRTWGLVKVRVPLIIIRLLKRLKDNFDVKAVCEFVAFVILENVKGQSGRRKYPDRIYNGWEYLKRLIERVTARTDNVEKLEKMRDKKVFGKP